MILLDVSRVAVSNNSKPHRFNVILLHGYGLLASSMLLGQTKTILALENPPYSFHEPGNCVQTYLYVPKVRRRHENDVQKRQNVKI